MLTLTRGIGESIVIGDDIVVTVKSIRGRHARLMISAPSGIPIYREEVYKSIEAENLAAAQVQAEIPPGLGNLAVQLKVGQKPEKKG
jgi:carbon storage regulator